MNELNNKRFMITILTIVGITIVGFVLGSFFDYDIAQSISQIGKTPVFSIVLTCGNLVPCMLACFAGTTLLIVPLKFSKFMNFAIRFVGAGVMIGFCFLTYTTARDFILLDQVLLDNELLLSILLGVVELSLCALAIFLTVIKSKQWDLNEAFWAALTIACFMLLYAAANEVVKYCASRARPKAVFMEGSVEPFRNWWEFRFLYCLKSGIGEDVKSFTSGHSANSATLIMGIPLLISATNFKNKKVLVILGAILGTLYLFTIAFSRMLGMFHFLSDVCGGMLITEIISIVTYLVVLKIRHHIEKKTVTL